MSESLFPMDESDEVALEISVKGLFFIFSHANTELYTYRKYPEVNHIYHQYYDKEDGKEKQIAIFEAPDLIEQLRELNFGERILCKPTDWDESAYIQFHNQKLEKELDEL